MAIPRSRRGNEQRQAADVSLKTVSRVVNGVESVDADMAQRVRETMYRLAGRATARLDLDLPLTTPVSRLSTAQQQLVEISKALLGRPKVLILDEPTSALNTREVDRLLDLVRSLADQSVAIIYVSHHMREIPIVTDMIATLRIATADAGQAIDTLSGGKGSIVGPLFGVLFVTILLNGMVLLGMNTYWQQVVRGGLVLFAVMFNSIRARQSACL